MNSPSTPVVGVVMTAYNSEPYIRIALESLQAQSMTEWECVVVDDGSTDATGKIVDEVARNDDRIRVIHRERGGVSTARNTGLAELSSDVQYVALLDSDDRYLPDALDELLNAIEERPDAVGVYGLAEYMDANGRPFGEGEHSAHQLARRAVHQSRLVDLDPESDSTFADISVQGSIWPSAVGLHRRSVVTKVGGFDTTFTRQGDWELYLRMSRFGPFRVVPSQVAWYRRHDDNLTGDVVASVYQQERVRRKAWESPLNTPEQRRIIARGARYLRLADTRRQLRRLVAHLKVRQTGPIAEDVVGFVTSAVSSVRPSPPPASLRRVRWTQGGQNGAHGPT